MSLDPILTPNCYISPGLGDFGDRYFGTLWIYKSNLNWAKYTLII